MIIERFVHVQRLSLVRLDQIQEVETCAQLRCAVRSFETYEYWPRLGYMNL